MTKAHNGSMRILVVDDDSATAELVARLLVQQGFRTGLASDGEEAMNRLAEELFDAVVSDVEMPGMSGFELLQNIRVRYPRLPVILMTSFFEDEKREAALAWSAAALLQKPFAGEQLAVALGAALPRTGKSPPSVA